MHSEPTDRPERQRSRGPNRPAPELADVLSDRHARAAVDCLRRSDGPVDLGDLSRRVVATITEEPPGEVPDDVARRVRTWLHHGHLPVLHTHGVVEFDPDAGTVSLAERDEPALPDEDDPPSPAEVPE